MTAHETAHEAPLQTGDGTSCDAFLGGALQICQPLKGYRAGLDAVLLAASVPQPPPGCRFRLLDVGAGVGVVGLAAAVRLPAVDVVLVEQSPELAELACRNIAANSLSGRADVVNQDIARPGRHLQLTDNSFDVVVANPPFYHEARHRPSPHALKAASHAMPDAGLETWVRFMTRMTRSGGVAIMVHRADHLPQMLEAFAPRFGALTLLPLYPRAGAASSRVLLRGVKGSRAPLTIAPGICLHGPGNGFTGLIDDVSRAPKSLEW